MEDTYNIGTYNIGTLAHGLKIIGSHTSKRGIDFGASIACLCILSA